jgi:hypothetical protein
MERAQKFDCSSQCGVEHTVKVLGYSLVMEAPDKILKSAIFAESVAVRTNITSRRSNTPKIFASKTATRTTNASANYLFTAKGL